MVISLSLYSEQSNSQLQYFFVNLTETRPITEKA